MTQNQERAYINVVKGIAVVLMIWGHCIQYSSKGSFDVFSHPIFQGIYSFHMPLFMLISGYLFWFSFQKRDLKTLLIRRTQSMLQPIVFASMLNNILAKLPTFLLHRTIRLTNGELFVGLYSLWFLWCVLSSSTAVAIAGKATRKVWLQLLYVILGVFLVALFPENHYHLYMYPYFVAGFYYGMYRSRIPSWLSRCAVASLVVFPAMLPFYKYWHLIYMTPVYTPEMELLDLLQLNGFRWGIGFAGSLFVLILSRWGFCFLEGRKVGNRVLQMLAKLGENSLAIYCISVVLLSRYLSKIFDRILLVAGRNVVTENMILYDWVFTPALTLVYCVGLYYVVLFMKKIKIHGLVFGR